MNERNKHNGSAKKPSSGFVGKETPVDLSTAVLQVKKFSSILNDAVNQAKKSLENIASSTVAQIKSIRSDVKNISNDITAIEKQANKVVVKASKNSKKAAKDASKEWKKAADERLAREKEFAKQKKQLDDMANRKGSRKYHKLVDEAKKLDEELGSLRKQAKATKSRDDYNRIIREISDTEEKFERTIEDANKKADQRTARIGKSVDMLVDGLMVIPNTLIGGIEKYSSAYESTFTDIATRGNFATREDARGAYSSITNAIKDSGLSGAVNIAEDAIPALADAYKQGFIGEDAIAKATSDATAKVLMPYLDTASESWIALSMALDENQLNQRKGMMLQLKESQAGNRLLQSGVVGSIQDELTPLLTNIEYNTGGVEMEAEYLALMEHLMSEEGGNYSKNDAYAYVKELMNADKNIYDAFTSGKVDQILYAQGRENGKGVIDSAAYQQQTIAGIGANTSTKSGSGAISSVYGGLIGGFADPGQWKRQRDAFGSDNMSKVNDRVSELLDTGKSGELYNSLLNNANEDVTSTEKAINSLENSVTDIAHVLTKIPFGAGWFASMLTAVTSIAASIAKDKLTNFISKHIGGKSKSAGDAGETAKSLFNKSGSGSSGGSGGFLKGIGKTLGKSGVGTKATKLIGRGSLIAGLAMMAKDGIAGYKKADEWGTSKGSAAVSGAILGSGDVGIKDALKKGASAEDKKAAMKNTLGQTAKYAALGAGIGSFIPGVGTAIGGAVGAGVGLISSIWSGKEMAEGIDKMKNSFKKGLAGLGEKLGITMSKAEDDLDKKVKEGKGKANSHASGLGHVPYDGYLAKLHQGEGILTANQNRLLKSNSAIFSMLTNNNIAKSITKASPSGLLFGSVLNKAGEVLRGIKKADENKEIIDAMRSCTSMIVQAINGNGLNSTNMQNGIKNGIKAGLLPALALKGAEKNEEMIGLFPSVPSTSSVV